MKYYEERDQHRLKPISSDDRETEIPKLSDDHRNEKSNKYQTPTKSRLVEP